LFPPDHKILLRKEKLGLLIEKYPEGLTIKDRNGQIHLHAAIPWQYPNEDEDESMDLLACVFDSFPVASQIRDSNGKTPLEVAMAEGQFNHALYLLQNQWGAIPVVHDGSANRNTILHTALKNNAPVEFLRL
jgi:ankyrin repeat protein